MKWIGVLMVPMLLLTGCASEMAKFQKQAEDHARDGKVDRAEVEDLIGLIDPDSDEFKRFVDDRGVVDTAGVISYLERYFDKRRSGTGAVDVWRPERAETARKLNVNVFVENSASMDGYVNGELGLKRAMDKLLNMMVSVGNDLNLYYINSKAIPRAKNAGPKEVADFVNELDKASFDKRGGNRTSTDLRTILDTVISKLDGNTTCALVSDFLLSSKKPGASIEEARSMGGAIRDLLNRMPNTALLAIHMEGRFDGKYYCTHGPPVPLEAQRPYYIWLLGPVEHLSSMMQSGIIAKLKDVGYKNHYLFQPTHGGCANTPGFEVVQTQASMHGQFKRGDKRRIIEAEWDKSDKHFGFQTAVDLSCTWQEGDYLLDTANYRVEGGYRIAGIRPIEAGDSRHGKQTHYIDLLTTVPGSLKEETIVIQLLAKKPGWIAQHSSTNDSAIKGDRTEQAKTLWLDDLMNGVFNAFHPDKDPCLASISIPIGKKK